MSLSCPPRFAKRPRFSDGQQSQSVLAARLRARKRRCVSVVAHPSRCAGGHFCEDLAWPTRQLDATVLFTQRKGSCLLWSFGVFLRPRLHVVHISIHLVSVWAVGLATSNLLLGVRNLRRHRRLLFGRYRVACAWGDRVAPRKEGGIVMSRFPSKAQPCGRPRSLRSLDAAR